MKRPTYFVLSMSIIALSVSHVHAVGFTRMEPTSDQSVDIGIWYPSETPGPSEPNTPFGQALAIDAVPDGSDLPLVIISHGNSGWMGSHADTALTLAEHGYVVAAMTHSDDNFENEDASPSTWIESRPQEVASTIDVLTKSWKGAEVVSRKRIGVFGFSAGGYTALVAAGGVPDFEHATRHCDANPTEFVCQIGLVNDIVDNGAGIDFSQLATDRRIRAASIAAPGFGFAFDAEGLQSVDVPVQLWSGSDDSRVPHSTNGEVIAEALNSETSVEIVQGAGHFAFLPPCRPELESANPRIWEMICVDEPDFDRAAFHTMLNDRIVEFFDDSLGSP